MIQRYFAGELRSDQKKSWKAEDGIFILYTDYLADLAEKDKMITTFMAEMDHDQEEAEYLHKQIAALKAELSDKSWRLRDPYGAFLYDAAKKDNCRNCVHMRPATLSSATDRISCKYTEGWPHWSTRCNKWEKKEALRGEEEFTA